MPSAARPKPTLSPWTPAEIFVRSLQAIRREPVVLPLLLGVLPTVWSLPTEWLRDWLTGAESSPATSTSVLLACVSAAWSTLVYGGELRIDPDEELSRSEEHTSELQSQSNLVCRLLLEKKKITMLLTQKRAC